MRLIESLKRKKFILFNIFFTLYIGINLIGGERGLISYFDKKRIYEELKIKDKVLNSELKDIELKILSRHNKNDQISVIIIPGASGDAEEHAGMLFLGSIICNLGYKVFIPRIPPLKELKLNKDCFEWVAHSYSEIIKSLLAPF